jgi:hypothetical protein
VYGTGLNTIKRWSSAARLRFGSRMILKRFDVIAARPNWAVSTITMSERSRSC